MTPAEAAIREALADATAGTLHAEFLAQACDPAAIRSLLSDLDALRARYEAAEALLRHALDALEYHRDQTRPIALTDAAIAGIRAHLKGAGRE